MRVQDVLRLEGMADSGISDSGVFATCSGCDKEHRLGSVETRDVGDLTEYVCPNSGTAFVFVGPEGSEAPELVGGTPHGGWIISSPHGMSIQVPGRGRIEMAGPQGPGSPEDPSRWPRPI